MKQYIYTSMFTLIGKSFETHRNDETKDGYPLQTIEKLILIDEVRKSGAKIYYRPSNFDFTSNGKEFFSSHSECYKSEDYY